MRSCRDDHAAARHRRAVRPLRPLRPSLTPPCRTRVLVYLPGPRRHRLQGQAAHLSVRWLLAGAMKLTADDRRWSAAVKSRDLWTCRKCGVTYLSPNRGLDAHHIFTRSRNSTRLEVECGVSLCVGHHRWAHANPLEFHQWIRGELGPDRYDRLQARSRVLKRTGT